jgi:hypothetical protein
MPSASQTLQRTAMLPALPKLQPMAMPPALQLTEMVPA